MRIQMEHLVPRVTAAASLLFIVTTTVVAQADPEKMGKCKSAQKEGDECALGICRDDGKQIVYYCAANMDCVKSKKEKDCTPPTKETPKKEN